MIPGHRGESAPVAYFGTKVELKRVEAENLRTRQILGAILGKAIKKATDAANLRGRLDRLLDLGRLTSKEVHFILNLMQEKYGFGYSDADEQGIKVGALQAKLSIMLELALKEGR